MDFDSSLSLEDEYYHIGYEEGTRDGESQGLIEGRIYGSEIAFERYLALGQLHARLSMWKQQHAANTRLTKHIQRVEELFAKMPKDNQETAEHEDYETVLAAITGKMKVISSLCGSESLANQGLLGEAQSSVGDADVEDGAELAIQLRGGQERKACASG